MSSYKARAIVLNSYKLGESDRIIKLLSSDGEIISAVAKGIRKVNNRFRGRLELFNLVDLELSTGKSLDVVSQAEILISFKKISQDFYKYVFCELLSLITLKTQVSDGIKSPLLYKLIYICFKEINDLDNEDILSLKKILCFFGSKLINIIGYTPILDVCSGCSGNLDNYNSFHNKKIFFSIKNGGLLCDKCSYMDEYRVVLDAKSLRLIRDLFNLKLEEFRDIEVNPGALKKICDLIERYIAYHTDCSIDSFNYLRKIGL